MSSDLPPTISPVAATRWAARQPTQSPWLHEEVARRMALRLQWMTLQPTRWLDWEPLQGGLQAHAALAQRYPGAQSYIVQPRRLRGLARSPARGSNGGNGGG